MELRKAGARRREAGHSDSESHPVQGLRPFRSF